MLELVAKCPQCGRAPSLRISDIHAHAVQGYNPKAIAMSYTCHWVGCGKVYAIPFRALQQSRPDKYDRAA